jgi:CYTH domain-containing protein
MATEIERKFLVADPTIVDGTPGSNGRQGYLSLDPERTVRVRVSESHGALTIKGRARGIERDEFEYEIPVEDARHLLRLCLGSLVEKRRHRLPGGNEMTWEIDVFDGDNAGLIVAEIELPSVDASFDRPSWLGPEVSDDPRYLNARLAQRPFRTWSSESRPPRARR